MSHRLQHRLHYPVALGILPIFAIVNTCIPLHGEWYWKLLDANSLGVYFGLVVGKPLGIVLFCFLAIYLKFGQMPESLTRSHLIGAGILAGIGFTMSIFISTLAFEDHDLINISQISVLLASMTAVIAGILWFLLMVPNGAILEEDLQRAE